MGQRYSKLPSEILEKGSTVDLMILGIVQKYYAKKSANDQTDSSEYTTDQLAEILNRTKNDSS